MKDVFRDVHVNSFVLKGEGSCPTTISILFQPYITRAISGLIKKNDMSYFMKLYYFILVVKPSINFTI